VKMHFTETSWWKQTTLKSSSQNRLAVLNTLCFIYVYICILNLFKSTVSIFPSMILDVLIKEIEEYVVFKVTSYYVGQSVDIRSDIIHLKY
jgi:hypothetical protein